MNAFNIIDLMDGLASSMITASAGGLAALAWLENEPTTAVIALALVGASLGFLPFNTAGPARIFLGDSGTMPLGFLVSALIPLALGGAANHPTWLASAPLFFCIPLVDASWRALKRFGRGVSLMTAGHDSLADSLQRRVATPFRVAALLAGAQALCSATAVGLIELDGNSGLVAALVATASLLAVSAASSGLVDRWADVVSLRSD
jgi:UDP-GlcNAc:undecaprenyl-phosphate GlcNAc-1-phosphate transferase